MKIKELKELIKDLDDESEVMISPIADDEEPEPSIGSYLDEDGNIVLFT